MKRILVAVASIIFMSFVGYAQQASSERVTDVETSSAYSMLILRKVAVEAELEGILSTQTRDSMDARVKQIELDALDGEIRAIGKTAEADLPKLTSGYGTLVLQRAKLESERQVLLLAHTSDFPGVRLKEVELNLLEHEIAKMMMR